MLDPSKVIIMVAVIFVAAVAALLCWNAVITNAGDSLKGAN
jgi:hypothetical protein